MIGRRQNKPCGQYAALFYVIVSNFRSLSSSDFFIFIRKFWWRNILHAQCHFNLRLYTPHPSGTQRTATTQITGHNRRTQQRFRGSVQSRCCRRHEFASGFGNFYLASGNGADSSHWLYGLLNLLTWPLSILWGVPEAAIDANRINEREMIYYYRYEKKEHLD